MPLLFSYGTLQREEVQLRTFGRRLVGGPDALVGYRPARVPIADPAVIAATGGTHHANAIPSDDPASRVEKIAFEITEAELVQVDAYEAPFDYARVLAPLASGRRAWVYVHTPRT